MRSRRILNTLDSKLLMLDALAGLNVHYKQTSTKEGLLRRDLIPQEKLIVLNC